MKADEVKDMDRKEAIEVVKKNYPHVATSGSALETALRELVPELAESEDERIRKMLVEQMERWKKCAEDNNVEQDVKDASAALVWLEKQKERERILAEREVTDIELDLHEIIAQARSDKRLADEDVLEQFEREAALSLTWAAEKQFRRDGKLKEQQPVPALDRGDEIILKAICEELKDAPGWVERIEGWYSLAKDAQRPVENTPICGDAAKKYFDSWIEKHRDSSTKWGCFWEGILYSRKLQKPVEWLAEFGFEQNGYDPVQVLKTIKEKCPAAWEKVLHQEWSEDDKLAIQNIVLWLSGSYISEGARKMCLEWFARRTDAFRLIKSSERSEEDEYKIDVICKLIERATIIPRSGDDDTGIPPTRLTDKYKGELKAFVKSTRPQPQWTPSKEQMSSLKEAIDYYKDRTHDGIVCPYLESLYEQLEKL